MLRLAALAAVAAGALAGADEARFRGVPFSKRSRYEGDTFRCGDGKTLPASRINDDFCDCADGSDEPGTSACANGQFYCVNKGFRGRFIPSMTVGDGVCDCCDGSDETANPRARCANTCEADGASWRTEMEQRIAAAESGARLRKAYADAGAAAKAERAARIRDLSNKQTTLKMELDTAEAAVKLAEEAEAIFTDKEKEKVGNGEARWAETLGVAGLDKEGLLQLLYDTVRADDHSPAFAEFLRKEAAEGRLPGLSEGFEPGWNPDAPDASALGISGLDRDGVLRLLIAFARSDARGDVLVELAKQRAAAGTLPGVPSDFSPRYLADPAAVENVKTPEGDAARDRLSRLRGEEGSVSRDLKSAEEEAGQDFGPDSAFYKLKGSCPSIQINQYKYEACPFGSAKQDYTSLGSYSGWGTKADGSTDYTVMKFTGGQHCWNGPSRSMTVHFECGSEDKILSVDEPEKCTYSARMTTPAACDARAAQELRLELDGSAGTPGPDRSEL